MTRFSQVKGPPSKTLNRKDKRKAERKLKKARKAAFQQRKYDVMKNLKDIDSAYKFDRKQKQAERVKKKEKQKKKDKKIAKKEAEDSRIQGLRMAIKKDDREIKQMEKNLKFRKKKGKTTIPASFSSDGLDYILDATDSEKIKDFDDVPLGGPLIEDSSTDSGNEVSDDELTTSDAPVSPWDPEAKAKKSILKSKEDLAIRKTVKFAEDVHDEDRTSSDNFCSDDEERMEESEEDEEDESIPEDESISDEDSEELPLEDDSDVQSIQIRGKRKMADEGAEELKEDIYGRLRDKEGNIVNSSGTGSYIPPAKRALMAGSQGNEVLHKKMKGFVNRVSEGTMQALSAQVESLYLDNSRADVNEMLVSLIMEAVICPTLSPERLVQELAMFVAILHNNVGSEVGAFFLQKLSVKFDELLTQPGYGQGKTMDNVLTLLSGFYNFKIVHSNFIIDIMKKLMDNFGERDIELLLLLLKWVGFTLRKDNPAQLKQIIMDIQSKAKEKENTSMDSTESRIRFMLEVLTALRNNNMTKIPGYNPSHLEHLRKLIKNMIRGQNSVENQLNIGLEDLLKADKKGRWWIVGSPWEGRSISDSDIKEAKSKTESFAVSGISKQMLKLAKQQGMNTDIRRHVFCILGTSEDFEDAFTRLLRLGLNRTQEREIVQVLFHCCLNEKAYNPFYGFLSDKFCTFDRRFAVTVKFTMWDKFKEIDSMEKMSRSNLGHLLAHLLISKALSLSVLKVIDFGMESKKMIRFLVIVLTEIFSSTNVTAITEVFERIAPFPKLKAMRQGLQVFMHVNLKGDAVKSMAGSQLQERIEKAEFAMFSHHTTNAAL